MLVLLSLMGLLQALLSLTGLLSSGPGPPNANDSSTGNDKLQPGSPPQLPNTKYSRRYSDIHGAPYAAMHGAPYAAVYGPTNLDSEGGYEAKLAVPSQATQPLFGVSHPYLRFMEDECGVTTVSEQHGSNGGSLDADEIVVTLKGTRLSVEYCRAEMREMILNMEVRRIKNRWRMKCRYHEESGRAKYLSVPDDMLAVLTSDGGKRIQDLERLTGAKIQVSEVPDPDDPNAHLVTIWGGAIDAAENGERELYNLLRVELAAVVDSATPGVWKIVSTVIDPKRAVFIIGEDGSTVKDLVDRTGCRIQFSNMILESYPAKQLVRITGPGDNPNEARREISRLIAEGDSRMPPRVHDNLAAQYYEDSEVAQQHYEN